LRKASKEGSHFDYEAGSLETLRRMVELNDGITILPELAAIGLTSRQQQLIRHFKRPAPMREVSLIVHRDFVKQRLVQALRQEIIKSIPEKVRQNKNLNVIPI
jgi:LysR family hydrogen peroxide-inducible transcriptional activator